MSFNDIPSVTEQNVSYPIGSKRLEKAPLLSQRRLFRSLGGRNSEPSIQQENTDDSLRTLGTFSGVFAPVSLSQFSSLLFLRIGFIIGNAGLLLACGSLGLAYVLLLFTILSICAISTNGAVEGGGAYFMISRTLGPEFGGAIGALFFFANIFNSAQYATGCIEGLLENFGLETGLYEPLKFLPEGGWYSFGYASILNTLNLFICLIGAGMFAKTTVIILLVVLISTASVIVSYLAIHSQILVPIPENNEIYRNSTGNYTGFSMYTLQDNLYYDYAIDYTTGDAVDFSTVFGVLFSGVTGIMAGANMSGELIKPGRSIPFGTLLASLFTFCMYVVLFFLTAATTSRFLLQNNYMFMLPINVWPPFVTIGVLTATWSASLSCIIGGSRVLAALVKDNIYGKLTKWIGFASIGNNPLGAVAVSTILVECVLLIGEMNTIAKFASVLFLLSYLATNIACLSLEWASAPNFRPTFRFFSWWTALLGIVCNAVMMFVVSSIVSSLSIILCLILVILLHFFSPSEHHKWGSISQALIFHQVRKYLLLLDSRKDHVKFWRPHILLFVANPRSACPLIDFVNDIKKSGLYVLGHVKVEEYPGSGPDAAAVDCPKWQVLVDHLKIKAFIEVTSAPTVRFGMQQLVRVAGLGAMKPNTIIFGYHDDSPNEDFFQRESSRFYIGLKNNDSNSDDARNNGTASSLYDWVHHRESKKIDTIEYVSMIRDVLNMGKNVCLCRYFYLLEKESLLKNSREKLFIDVWPMNFFLPNEVNVFDTSSLFMMQLATVLNMVSTWSKKTSLRVFLCVTPSHLDTEKQKEQVKEMLHELRIDASIQIVNWDGLSSLYHKNEASSSDSSSDPHNLSFKRTSREYLSGVNQMIRENSTSTALSFLYLPSPPDDEFYYPVYLDSLTLLSQHLHPTLLVHGVSAVTTTTL